MRPTRHARADKSAMVKDRHVLYIDWSNVGEYPKHIRGLYKGILVEGLGINGSLYFAR